jgi:hypothetical protein
MFGEISEKKDAIQFLMDKISKDCLKNIWVAVQNKGSCWSFSVNSCFGIYVRNTLGKGGFDCEAYTLDNVWGIIIKEASRRMEASKANS